jgi:hypothetical protein
MGQGSSDYGKGSSDYGKGSSQSGGSTGEVAPDDREGDSPSSR